MPKQMKREARLPFKFIGQIKRVTSKIDIVGDKVASMTIDFYATDENLREINAMQQPEMNVEFTMKKSDG